MARRITKAGIRRDKALAMERRLKKYEIPEKLIATSSPLLLSPLLQASKRDVQAIQQCIGMILEQS